MNRPFVRDRTMHIRILWPGRTRSAPIRSLLADYGDRMGRLASCSIVELPDLSRKKGLRGADLVAAEARLILEALAPEARVAVLDGAGREFSSAELAGWMAREMNRGTRQIDFVVGGPEGLGGIVLKRADLRLSLGRMTWTHEMCRALLLEQLYRVQCILKGIPYHK